MDGGLNFSVTFDQAAFAKFAKRLDPAAYKVAAHAGLREAGLFLQRKLVLATPKKTGVARASISEPKINNMVAVISSPLNYMQVLEEGSKAHVIRPKKSKVLAFQGSGGKVFARSVNHPGTKPRHMFRDTMAKYGSAAIDIIARHLAKAGAS